jgi:hypothetical protein
MSWAGVITRGLQLRQVGHTAKFSKMTPEAAYGREINIKFSGNSFGGLSCSQHDNCTLPQNLTHLWHCVVTKHFRAAFYFPQVDGLFWQRKSLPSFKSAHET